MLKLICQAGAKIGHEIKITKPRYTIGRQAGNDLELPSPFVSKFHAEIRCDEKGKYWIEDLRSTNGTFIDKSEVNRATCLEDGHTIIIGKSDIFKIMLVAEPANVPAYFNINDNLDIQPELLKSKLKLSAKKQPTRPIGGEEESPENVSDSWLNLMGLGPEISHEFNYSEDLLQTQSLDPSKSNWPDVVKMSQRLDTYKRLFRVARDLLAVQDEGGVIEIADEIISTILPFQNGVLVLHTDANDPATWKTQHIRATDHFLMETSFEIHQSESGNSTKCLAFKSRPNGLLYHPLKMKNETFGFIALSAALDQDGFLDNEKRGFRLVCQLLESTFAKFRER